MEFFLWKPNRLCMENLLNKNFVGTLNSILNSRALFRSFHSRRFFINYVGLKFFLETKSIVYENFTKPKFRKELEFELVRKLFHKLSFKTIKILKTNNFFMDLTLILYEHFTDPQFIREQQNYFLWGTPRTGGPQIGLMYIRGLLKEYWGHPVGMCQQNFTFQLTFGPNLDSWVCWVVIQGN